MSPLARGLGSGIDGLSVSCDHGAGGSHSGTAPGEPDGELAASADAAMLNPQFNGVKFHPGL